MAFCWKLRRRKGPPAFFLDNGEDDLPWTDTDDLEWARSKRGGREIVWDGDQETDPWINRVVISDEYCPAQSEGHQRKRDYGTLAWWPRVQSAEWLGRCARRGGNRISSIPHQGGSWKLPVRSTCHTNASLNILVMHRLCTSCPKDAILTHSLTCFTIGFFLLQSSDIFILSHSNLWVMVHKTELQNLQCTFSTERNLAC